MTTEQKLVALARQGQLIIQDDCGIIRGALCRYGRDNQKKKVLAEAEALDELLDALLKRAPELEAA